MELDDAGRGLFYFLQQDARRSTSEKMAANVGVSVSTVRNRIERIEENGIIRGYYPDIDHDNPALQRSVEIICRTPNPEREALVAEARGVGGVVSLREVLHGKENVQIDAIGTESDDVARVTDELCEIGLQVVNTKITKETYSQPFNHFGQHLVEDATLEQ